MRPQSELRQSLIRPIHRYLLPPRPHSTCPSQQSSSTRKKSTRVNTTSTRTVRLTASFRSMTPSSWRGCRLERIGRERVGRVWRRARITILVLGVGGEWRSSFCRVGGLLMMRSRESRSRLTSKCFFATMAGRFSCVYLLLSPLSSPSVRLVALGQIQDFLRDIVQTHLSGHRGESRDYYLSQQPLNMVPGSIVRVHPCCRVLEDTRNTYSFAYPIPPILQTAVSQAVKAFSPARYLTAFAYSPVAKPSSHIFAACIIINRVLSS
jgi:hypothetical protein